LIENTTIKKVIENGLEPYKKYIEEYTEENVILDYENIIDTILNNKYDFIF
jgi:type III secretory pathway component EscR